MSLPVQSMVEALRGAGFSLSVTADGGLAVSPASRLTPELREVIRNGKADLVRWFTRPAANEVKPPTDRGAWHELADAYHRHHFNCASCQAAGRGTRYGLRCAVGISLWIPYAQAAQ